ncbi:uveal autoantigen with coiled-coil domains and ankyrin repeats isoform X1 [Anopheles gambiae]|uniref:uveal autoantigen with coiled-coil domains and ankyrin repeats isoform X1 n=1 Tax=Anopheles gambiae TaxID=7165 RepID=UPI002AC9CF70|nr:uveal autoantigen with coiled-coil domains and ankyrin repeats isoform X1 [Anopheles gambiae]
MDRLKAENEELRQELYTVKKKLQVAKQISTDLSDELEQQVAKSNRQLEQMRTEHATQLKAQEAQIEQLSKELAAQRSEPPQQGPPADGPVPEHIEETLRMVQEKSLRAKQDWEEDELQYQSEIVQLQQKLTTADRKLTGALTNIAELSEEIELLREQLASKKGNLEIKAQEAEELRDLLEATQQQNGMLAAELAGLRSNSNSALEKGNSLFREVADQRKQLMHRYNQLKQRFFQLKSEHEDCPREIRTLRMAQRESQTQYERCVKLVRSAEYYNVQALHEQIKDLTEQLARADRRVRHLEHEMASNSFAWVNVLVEYYTKEMDTLKSSLNSYQHKHRQAMDMQEDAVKEAWKWRLEAQRMRLKMLQIEVPPAPADMTEGAGSPTSDTTLVPDRDEQREGSPKDTVAPETVSAENKSHDVTVICNEKADESGAKTITTTTTKPPMKEEVAGAMPLQERNANQLVMKIVPFKCYKLSDLIAKQKEETDNVSPPEAKHAAGEGVDGGK